MYTRVPGAPVRSPSGTPSPPTAQDDMSFRDPSGDSKLCKICDARDAVYSCPRCGAPYCSLDCYRSERHSRCSEAFYRECVQEEMTSVVDDPETKSKMLRVLEEMHRVPEDEGEESPGEADSDDGEPDSDDGEPVASLAERLLGVDLEDSERIWRSLTEDERREFEALGEAEVAELVPEWTPWWTLSPSEPVVVPLDEENDHRTALLDHIESCPKILSTSERLSDISARPPADCVKYNLVNVLASYVYTARLFDGDHVNTSEEATSCFLSLTLNLKSGGAFEDVTSAVKSIVHQSHNYPSYAADHESEKLIRSDLRYLFKGVNRSKRNFYVLCALSDVHNLLSSSKKSTKKEKKESGEFHKKFSNGSVQNPSSLRDVKNAMKKIEYYITFVWESGDDICDRLLSQL